MRVVLTAALVLASLTGATWPAMAASTWRSWTVNDGLYESYSKLVIPTSDGLVWIRHGLAERVSVFDGFDITVAEGTDLGDVSVAGRDGSLWSWHLRANELRWTRDDRIERFAIPLHPETQKKQRLVGFEAVETGGVLVLTTARVYFFRQSIAESEVMLTAGDGLIGGFLALAKDLEGRVWVTGDHGVARFGWTGSADKMQLQRVWRHESFPGCVGAEKFYALTVGRDGEAFVTVRRSNDFAIYHFLKGRWGLLTSDTRRDISAWRGDGDAIWISHGDRLELRRANVTTEIDRGLTMSGIFGPPTLDDGDSFWLSTDQGLVRHAPALWRPPTGFRILDEMVLALAEDAQGTLWALTPRRVAAFDQDGYRDFILPAAASIRTSSSGALFALPNGNIMFGKNAAVLDPHSGKFSGFKHPDGRVVAMVVPDSPDETWLVSYDPQEENAGYLQRFDGERFRAEVKYSTEVCAPNVRGIAELPSGDIWIGGTLGLCIVSNGQSLAVEPSEAFGTQIHALRADADGTILAGGQKGMFRVSAGIWTPLVSRVDRVRDILPDGHGGHWVASASGVVLASADATIQNDVQEGLPSSIVMTLLRRQDGSVLAGTTRGLSQYFPLADPEKPRVMIAAQENIAEVSPGGATHVNFRSIDRWNMTEASRMLYSHRIDDGEWTRFSEESYADFDALAAGQHHVEARAMDRAGNSSEESAMFTFSVLSHWYEQPGFLVVAAICVLALILLCSSLLSYYRNRRLWIAQLIEARDDAEAGSRAKSEFLANMSHELRTPMNGVLGMTELVLETDLSSDQKDCLQTAHTSAQSLLAILNGVLDISKVESGKLRLESTRFDLEECLLEVLRAMALDGAKKGVEVVASVASNIPRMLYGDPVRVKQVLLNLAGNAVKFTECGVVRVVVCSDIEPRSTGPISLLFEIADSGIGISPDKQQTVFEKFVQADTSITRKFGGTGLGLAITKSLLDLMNGSLELASPWPGSDRYDAGPGSCFSFRLKFGVPSPSANRGSIDTLRGLKVLVADDNDDACELTSLSLESLGAKIESAASGTEALGLLSRAFSLGEPFDCALLDAGMSDMQGSNSVEAIFDRERFADTRRVLMVAPGGSPSSQPAPARLQKPFRLDELAAAVDPSKRSEITTPPSRLAPIRVAVEGLRILLAEDNPVNQTLAKRILQKHGYEVVIAENGLRAVQAWDSQRFDLILMDVQMPEMDGLAAIREIRARESLLAGHIPILAVTAHALDGDKERCLESGADGYLSKPFKAADLLAAVEDAVSVSA